MKKISHVLDIIYIAVMLIIIALNIITKNELMGSIAFLVVAVGFFATNVYNSKYRNDERVRQIYLTAGYFCSMLTILLLMIGFIIIRYVDFMWTLRDILQYLSMFMFLVYTVATAFLKRKV